MDWDLITERNIQLFIQLAGLAERPLGPICSGGKDNMKPI